MLWKCCSQYASKFGKLSSGHRTGKGQFSFQSPRKATFKKCSVNKECSYYCTTALISHASKVMLKIFQERLQQYMNRELPDVQIGFRKGRGTQDEIADICCIIEKARECQKTSTSVLLITPKTLAVWIITNCGKFLRRWESQTTLPAFWEICMQVKKQQNQISNNGLVPNWERSMSRLYIVTLLI